MMMRKTRRYKNKRKKKIIIISTLCLLFFMVAGYAAFETNLNISAKGNIVDRSRVIQNWSSTSNEDFHTDYYRENIVSVTFLDDARVPSDAIESWDVSEVKDKGVMAYVIPNDEDNTKYDLYIGANGGVIANEDSSNFFREFSGIIAINFNNNFDTSNTVKMNSMFRNTSSLQTLDLSSFDTKNVVDMSSMFYQWDDEKGTTIDTALKTITFGDNFSTSNVTNMIGMFLGCTELLSLDVSGFDTHKVENMRATFSHLDSLTTLDVSNFDTSNVTNMQNMFGSDLKLEILNLCNFDTRKVTNMYGMFDNTVNLKNIYVGSNWSTAQADTTYMFLNSNISSVTTGQC